MHTTIRRAPLTIMGAVVALLVALAMLTVAQAAAAKDFEGKVISKSSVEKTFRLNTGEGDGKFRFHTNGSTNYERISGFGAIERGMRLDVRAKRANGHWLATKVER
jgi:Domain of unknown function (DUF5666)